MPCLCMPGSPCGGPPRGFMKKLEDKFGITVQNDIVDCFEKVKEILDCAENREMRKAMLTIQSELTTATMTALKDAFPSRDECFAEHVPNIIKVVIECLPQCQPESPAPFLLCVAQKAQEDIVGLVRCLLTEEQITTLLDTKLSLREWNEMGQSLFMGAQQGKAECLVQMLVGLLPLLCGGLGGGLPPGNGGGGGIGDDDWPFKPSEKDRGC